MNIERRIAELEKKAGTGREAAIVVLANYRTDNVDCPSYDDTKRCGKFREINRWPGGVTVERSCEDCEGAQT